MENNLFEELQAKKQRFVALANKAAEYGWIPMHKSADANGVISCEEIIEKLENDTLTIGVIGQMKCGKSTFLNSFVFEDDVLPAATTPMTAALSVITYGEDKRIVADFYNKDEWAEQKMQAGRNLDEVSGDALEESKIKAAKELVFKAAKLGGSLDSLLGKTQEDSFDKLIEYVGADGKYVSITKSVTIYYPKDYLKGVQIVDTPGFNDPIVSREERTKEFLKKADVVLMMLYAGRPFDATDRDIIFKNVRQCGIGKVLVGINKFDIPFCSETNPETEDQIKDYVKSEIQKACRECGDQSLVQILQEVEPIPLSAEMALLSELPMSKILESDSFNFAWKRHCDNFGISTQKEMRAMSHQDNLVDAIKALVNTEKDKILFSKSLNAIVAAGDKRKSENGNELRVVNGNIEALSMPDSKLDEREEGLAKGSKRLAKKIDSLDQDIDEVLCEIKSKGKKDIEECVSKACDGMRDKIDQDFGFFKNAENFFKNNLEPKAKQLFERDLPRLLGGVSTKGKKKIISILEAFFNDVEDVFDRYPPSSDFNKEDFVKESQRSVQLSIEGSDLFSYSKKGATGESAAGFAVGGVAVAAMSLAFPALGIVAAAYNGLFLAINRNENKQKLNDWVNSIRNGVDPEPYLQSAFSRKDEIIGDLKKKFFTDLLEPLQHQIEEIKANKANKENELKSAIQRKEALESEKAEIQKQLDDIDSLKNSLQGK